MFGSRRMGRGIGQAMMAAARDSNRKKQRRKEERTSRPQDGAWRSSR